MATVYKVMTGKIPMEVVTGTGKNKMRETVETRVVRWASAEGAAKKARRELMETYGVKMADVSIEQVDVPTSKAGIIEWLSVNHSRE